MNFTAPGKYRLYSICLLLSGVSFFYITWSYSGYSSDTSAISYCVLKNVSGLPCPSCGTTRSVFHFLDGEFLSSLLINPLGLLAVLILTIVPVWIMIDILSNRSGFFNFYLSTEKFLKTKKWALISLLMLFSVNWVWNILKGL